MNHSSQVIVFCSVFSMKPTATMFCAAAVLMPTFQMLAVCIVVIMSMLAKAPLLVDAERRDDAEHDRHDAGDARRRGGHQERHHEADQDRAHDDMTGFSADAGEDDERDALVEAGRRHGRGEEQGRGHQRQRGIGEAAERKAQAALVPCRTLGLAGLGAVPSRKAMSAAITTADTA